jgi:TPR repeat protein
MFYKQGVTMKLFFLSLLLISPIFEVNAKTAYEIFEAGQYDKAYRAAYADALNGNSNEAFIVGKILLEGLGAAEKDQQLAVKFLKKSAEAKNMEAAQYLGNAYDQAKFLPKSNSLAYKFLSLAKELGADDLNEQLLEIASNLGDEISPETCNLYGEQRRNTSYAFSLGECIEGGFIEGSANDYYLIAFDEGETDALISAMRLALVDNSEKLQRVFNQLDKFLLDAPKSSIKEITNLIKSKELELPELVKTEENKELSYQLAVYYEEGSLFGESNKKRALSYYELAASQGKSGLKSKLQEVRIAVRGSTSKGACKGYSKSNKTKAKTLAKCAQKGHISGSEGEYFLLAFENGDVASLIEAAATLIDRNSDAYAPEKILNAMPDFRAKASPKQTSLFGEMVDRKGHSSRDCEEKFDRLNTKISGDIYSCMLSAEAAQVTGDFSSVLLSIELWRSGYAEVLSNDAHAQNLQEVIKSDPNVGGELILVFLENEPMEHFKQAKLLFENGRISKDQATKALELEFKLFSEGRWAEFTGETDAASQIDRLLDMTNLSLIQPDILARFLAYLVNNESDLAESKSVKNKLDTIEFDLAWAEILVELDNNAAGVMVFPHIGKNCDALQLAIDSDGLISDESLAAAKKSLLSECDIFNVTAEDFKQIFAENSEDGSKKLGILLTSQDEPLCETISTFIIYEEKVLASKQNFRFEIEPHVDRCLNSDKEFAYTYSSRLLASKNYIKSFEISEIGCENESPAACAIAGYIKFLRLDDATQQNFAATKTAKKLLKRGMENGDLNSTMIFISATRPSLGGLNIFSASSPEQIAKFENKLKQRQFSGMPIVNAEACSAKFALKGRCKPECRLLEDYLSSDGNSVIHQIHGQRVFRKTKCNS